MSQGNTFIPDRVEVESTVQCIFLFQATALPLLKAILMRKLSIKEIAEVMEKIAELSIRDADSSIRLQCRQLMMTYLVEYPLGKKITKHFDFYISNLS